MKRFIECYIPVTTCNFRCHYCYITQQRKFSNALPQFKYDIEYVTKALSIERLGGVCHLNLCGGGETLLPPEVPKLIKSLLEEGHYLMVVTNGSMTKRIDEIINFPKDLLERLCFKISFHYLELVRLSKIDEFFKNINKIKEAGCSFTVEITPNDELVPYIQEIKKITKEYLGTMCHVTIARKDIDKRIPILTKYSIGEYEKIWDVFSSKLFEFKLPLYYKKRKEFCYAGEWSAVLNVGTGELSQCYAGEYLQNIYKNINEPIKFLPVGHTCKQAHCYNAHSFLTLGVIPEMDTPTYAEMRNRVCEDGSEWLMPKMKLFFNRKLKESNTEYSDEEKQKNYRQNKKLQLKNRLRRLRTRIFGEAK